MSTLLARGARRFQERPALVLLTGQVVAAAVAFAINIMSAAVMDPTGRGNLALLLQVTYLLTVVAMLGIERPYLARRHASFDTAVSELRLLFRPGSWLAAVLVLLAAVFFLRGDVPLGVAMALVAAYLIGNMHVAAVRVAYISSGSVSHFARSTIASQLALLGMGGLLLLMQVRDPNLWFMSYALMSFIAVAIVFFNRDRSVVGPVRNNDALASIRRQGFKMLPASLGNTAMLRSDRLVLPVLASSAELGIYVVVATVMELATWPVQQWVDASLRKWNGSTALTPVAGLALMAKAAGLVSVLSLAFGIVAYLAVVNLLPKAYMGSLELIAPLGIAAIFYAMTRVQQGLLIAQGHAGRVSLVEVVGMVASVAMYLVLIPGMGAMGAALGSAIGYFICLIFGVIVFARSRPSNV